MSDSTRNIEHSLQATRKNLMPCLISLLGFLLAAGCSWLQGTVPVPYTKKAYTATYERRDSTGKAETWVISAAAGGHEDHSRHH